MKGIKWSVYDIGLYSQSEGIVRKGYLHQIIKKMISILIWGMIIGLINAVGITLFIEGDISGIFLLFCSFLLFIYVLSKISLTVVTYFLGKYEKEKGLSER